MDQNFNKMERFKRGCFVCLQNTRLGCKKAFTCKKGCCKCKKKQKVVLEEEISTVKRLFSYDTFFDMYVSSKSHDKSIAEHRSKLDLIFQELENKGLAQSNFITI